MKIHIVVSALPPQMDGIGDYTANLSAELAKSANVTILTREGFAHAHIPHVRITPVFSVAHTTSIRRIVEVVAQDKPDWVLLQYNPFSYGRWGLNLHLPSAMSTLKRRSPGTRLALMVHERYVPIINAKFAVMATWQRWQFVHLGRCADVIFFSTSGWAQEFSARRPGKPVVHLPVGSNIPCIPTRRKTIRAELGIADSTFVVGLFGTAHPSRLIGWVRDAACAIRQSGQDVLILYIGPHGRTDRSVLSGLPLLDCGTLPANEVSRRFAAMDIVLTPFVDGVSTRRGSFMAGLQHGIAMVGTRGLNTDDLLLREDRRSFLLADVTAPKDFVSHVQSLVKDATLRERIGREGKGLYEREFAWGRIAECLRMEMA